MQVRVLGPVEAGPVDHPVPLGGRRPRTIVAALALSAGPVSSERLIDEVWRDDPPPSAIATLQSYLSRLRRTFGRGRLTSHPAGYRLELSAGSLDAEVFLASLREARAANGRGERCHAIAAYEAALRNWRGGVAEGLEHGPILREASARFNELRLSGIEERIDVLLTEDRHDEVIAELEAMTVAHPHRERFHAQRLIALYRCGRQAEALDAYRQAREALVAAVGIEPGPHLRELHRRILEQDPSLGVQANATTAAPGGVSAGSNASSASAGPHDHRWDGDESVVRTNLPAPVGPFVGRVAVRRDVAARLTGDVRLLTLVGAGGCGKTQLALRVAHDLAGSYPSGVWWVELAAYREPDRVISAVADAVGVAAASDAEQLHQVGERLQRGHHLLVLDNCEHLVAPCADLVTELLRRSPMLRILATSREPLDVDGEQLSRVPSLAVPSSDASPEETFASEAATLLILRGQASRPDLELTPADGEAVARICRALDGIPLALELAGARLNVLSLPELADRLDEQLAVLGSGRRTAPARHRTLEAAIGWSYDLLTADQQRLLSALTIFRGGSTVADAEVVCREVFVTADTTTTALPTAEVSATEPDVVDQLGALIDKSLVQRSSSPDGRTRLDLLVTVRRFARARLEPERVTPLRDRHADHFAQLAEDAAPRLTGPEQVRWLNRIHAEQDNLRVVLERGDELSARIAAAVWWFWLQFGHIVEGNRWVQAGLVDAAALDPQVRVALLRGAARLAAAVDEPDRALVHIDQAIGAADASRSAHLGVGIAADEAFRARLLAEAGERRAATSGLARARELARTSADSWTAATVEHQAALIACRRGRLGEAATAAAAAQQGFNAADDQWSACLARLDAALIARQRGELVRAVDLHQTNLERGLELTVSSLDFVGLPQDLQGLADLALLIDRPHLSARLLGATASVRAAVELPGGSTRRYAALVGAVEEWLGADGFERHFVAGRTSSAERSVARALDVAGTLRELLDDAALSTDPG